MKTTLQRTEPQEPAAVVVTDKQKRLLMVLADPCSNTTGLLSPDRQAIQAALDEIHYWRDLDWRRRNYEEDGEISVD